MKAHIQAAKDITNHNLGLLHRPDHLSCDSWAVGMSHIKSNFNFLIELV